MFYFLLITQFSLQISVDVHRWQDGAIVANNPTVFSIREAQLLWPDTRIDCLVSIGCGSVPTKVATDCFYFVFKGSILNYRFIS